MEYIDPFEKSTTTESGSNCMGIALLSIVIIGAIVIVYIKQEERISLRDKRNV
jgi:hypothetical protein